MLHHTHCIIHKTGCPVVTIIFQTELTTLAALNVLLWDKVSNGSTLIFGVIQISFPKNCTICQENTSLPKMSSMLSSQYNTRLWRQTDKQVGLSNLCHDNAVMAADAMSARRVISVQVTMLIVRLHLLASDHDCRSVARIYKLSVHLPKICESQRKTAKDDKIQRKTDKDHES